MRKNGAAKCLDLMKGFSDVSTVASVPMCLQDCVLSLLDLSCSNRERRDERMKEGGKEGIKMLHENRNVAL